MTKTMRNLINCEMHALQPLSLSVFGSGMNNERRASGQLQDKEEVPSQRTDSRAFVPARRQVASVVSSPMRGR